MQKEIIACIAGTPVDTKMGADKLIKSGYEVYEYPSSTNPTEEMLFQISSDEVKTNKLRSMLFDIKKKRINKVIVYCNSLSAAVDFKKLSKETELKIITPFDVYEKEANKYKCLGIIAANAVATSKIEKAFLNVNKNISIISIGMLPLVISIESGLNKNDIIKKHKLDKIYDWFYENGAEAILLGCTHFPYIYEELIKFSKIPIIEPSKKMIELLK